MYIITLLIIWRLSNVNFDFKLFEPKKNRIRENQPKVEITASGRIMFNRMAVELLSGKTYCKLGFDSNSSAIGVLPTEENDLNAFNIRYTAKGAYIGAKKFLQHFGIIPSSTISMTPVQAGQFIGVQINRSI